MNKNKWPSFGFVPLNLLVEQSSVKPENKFVKCGGQRRNMREDEEHLGHVLVLGYVMVVMHWEATTIATI